MGLLSTAAGYKDILIKQQHILTPEEKYRVAAPWSHPEAARKHPSWIRILRTCIIAIKRSAHKYCFYGTKYIVTMSLSINYDLALELDVDNHEDAVSS
jgi:hypothetical protein